MVVQLFQLSYRYLCEDLYLCTICKNCLEWSPRFLFLAIGLPVLCNWTLYHGSFFVITSTVTVSLGAFASTKGQIVDSASHDMFLQHELASFHTSSKNTGLKTIPVHCAGLPREISFPYLICVSIS